MALRTFFKAIEPESGLVLPLALTKPMQNLATQIFEENCSLRLFFQISLFLHKAENFSSFQKNAKRPKTDEIKNAVDKFDAKKAFWVQRLCIDLDQT